MGRRTRVALGLFAMTAVIGLGVLAVALWAGLTFVAYGYDSTSYADSVRAAAQGGVLQMGHCGQEIADCVATCTAERLCPSSTTSTTLPPLRFGNWDMPSFDCPFAQGTVLTYRTKGGRWIAFCWSDVVRALKHHVRRAKVRK